LLSLLLGAACLPCLLNSQTLPVSQIPGEVRQGFQSKFPGVRTAEWKLKPDKNYEAEFDLNGAETAAKFAATGKWLETETAIPRAKVPRPVTAAVTSAYPHYKVIETQSLLTAGASHPIYEIHVQNAREVVKLQYAADGRLVQQSAKASPSR
jgi:hypothetical protein